MLTRKLKVQFSLAAVLGTAALFTAPNPAQAATDCGTSFCVSSCPAHPDQFCSSFDCPNTYSACATDASCDGAWYSVVCATEKPR